MNREQRRRYAKEHRREEKDRKEVEKAMKKLLYINAIEKLRKLNNEKENDEDGNGNGE